MNKAFVREPDQTADYCPRCGSQGQPVTEETLAHQLLASQRNMVYTTACFCPSPQCEVVYFDAFERVILTSDLGRAVYPKDLDAPICPCFGLTRDDIEADIREGVTTRVKALLEKARSPAARCVQMAANGRPCTAYVQKYYMSALQRK
jgi:hypothetical protein